MIVDQKCMDKILYYELQVEIQKLRLQNSSGQITYIQDDKRINQLMKANKEIRNQEQQMRIQNKQLLEDLESWKSRYKLLWESNSKSSGLDEEIRQLKKKINELSEDLVGSHKQIQQRDNEILNLKQLLDDNGNVYKEKQNYGRKNLAEKLAMSETQLEAIKKGKQQSQRRLKLERVVLMEEERHQIYEQNVIKSVQLLHPRGSQYLK